MVFNDSFLPEHFSKPGQRILGGRFSALCLPLHFFDHTPSSALVFVVGCTTCTTYLAHVFLFTIQNKDCPVCCRICLPLIAVTFTFMVPLSGQPLPLQSSTAMRCLPVKPPNCRPG